MSNASKMPYTGSRLILKETVKGVSSSITLTLATKANAVQTIARINIQIQSEVESWKLGRLEGEKIRKYNVIAITPPPNSYKEILVESYFLMSWPLMTVKIDASKAAKTPNQIPIELSVSN